MDPLLLRYYNSELQYFREMSGEFAEEYPAIAGRLKLDAFECADPYVERLIEGFAFMAARVRLKVDARFPRFTQHLMELVYPHFLPPLPSMAVVAFKPKPDPAGPADPIRIPRGAALYSTPVDGIQTSCEFRTGHEVTLWPVKVSEAEYLGSPGALASYGDAKVRAGPAAIRLRLETTVDTTFEKLNIDRLVFYLGGPSERSVRLYEALVTRTRAVAARPAGSKGDWEKVAGGSAIRAVGLEPDEALLPYCGRSFDGYRSIHEYFAFPSRMMFVELSGLAGAMHRCAEKEIDILIYLKNGDPELDRAVDHADFSLFCVPAINLFEKRGDRVQVKDLTDEYHVVIDRGRPMDFEVYRIKSVVGIGAGNEVIQEFHPFFGATDIAGAGPGRAYYAVSREPRRLSAQRRRTGPRSSYIGSEVSISLVDADQPPHRSDLRQLDITALCTNRDLPLHMPVRKNKTDKTDKTDKTGKTDETRNTDFTLRIDETIGVYCVAGPTRPRPSHAEGDMTWRLISHLSLNYLTLVDKNPEEGAAAFRELLSLYADLGDASTSKQIAGVKSITSRPVVRRAAHPGPIAFVRGLEVAVTFVDEAFEGSGPFLLATVIQRFLAKYVTINSFTEMVFCSDSRGEIMRWQSNPGQRHAI
jgi:type VI secretion system protein ImpG